MIFFDKILYIPQKKICSFFSTINDFFLNLW